MNKKRITRNARKQKNNSFVPALLFYLIIICVMVVSFRNFNVPDAQASVPKPHIENLLADAPAPTKVIYEEPTYDKKAFEQLIDKFTGPEKQKPLFRNAKTLEFTKARDCLARNIFYEAPRYYEGKEAQFGITREAFLREIERERIKVINVTLNRLKSERYPNDVCGVIYQHKQFSWTLEWTKANKTIGEIYKTKPVELANLKIAKEMANKALLEGYPDLTGGAIYYHTHTVAPSWGKKKEHLLSTRWHIFYRDKQIVTASAS